MVTNPPRKCAARLYRQSLQNSSCTEGVRTSAIPFRPKERAIAPQIPLGSTHRHPETLSRPRPSTRRCPPHPGGREQPPAGCSPSSASHSLPAPAGKKKNLLVLFYHLKVKRSPRLCKKKNLKFHIPGRRKRFAPAGSKMPRRGGGKPSLCPPSFPRGFFLLSRGPQVAGTLSVPPVCPGLIPVQPGRWDQSLPRRSSSPCPRHRQVPAPPLRTCGP